VFIEGDGVADNCCGSVEADPTVVLPQSGTGSGVVGKK